METLSEEILLLADSVVAGAEPGTQLDDGSFSIVVRDQRVDTVTERTQYDCPLGGTLTTEVGRMVISESSYSNSADHDSVQFEQCRLATDGEQMLDGTVRTLTNSVSASRAGFDDREVQWTNLVKLAQTAEMLQ